MRNLHKSWERVTIFFTNVLQCIGLAGVRLKMTEQKGASLSPPGFMVI